MLMVAGLLGMFFLAVLYLQRVLGYDAVEHGRGVPADLAVDRRALARLLRAPERAASARATCCSPALASIAAGLALLSRVPVDGSYVADLLPAMLLLGIGGGLAFPALMTLAMSGATPEDSGLASGLVNTTQQVGGALGLAILATVAANRTGGATDGGRWSTATAPRSRSPRASWSWRSSSPRSSCAAAPRRSRRAQPAEARGRAG